MTAAQLATQQAAQLRTQLLASGALSPEARAEALTGRQVQAEEAFEAVRRAGMERCPLPERQGPYVEWLRRVWEARQAFGRAFARELLAGEMSAIADNRRRSRVHGRHSGRGLDLEAAADCLGVTADCLPLADTFGARGAISGPFAYHGADRDRRGPAAYRRRNSALPASAIPSDGVSFGCQEGNRPRPPKPP